nr:hypothetical protein [Tanacetum cinerariifolium]
MARFSNRSTNVLLMLIDTVCSINGKKSNKRNNVTESKVSEVSYGLHMNVDDWCDNVEDNRANRGQYKDEESSMVKEEDRIKEKNGMSVKPTHMETPKTQSRGVNTEVNGSEKEKGTKANKGKEMNVEGFVEVINRKNVGNDEIEMEGYEKKINHDKKLAVDCMSKQAIFCLLEVFQSNVKFYCTFVYASNSGTGRSLWQDLEHQRIIMGNHPWLILGDFNQKAKVNWMKNGDKNTAFLHSILKDKKNKNRVESICDESRKRFNGDEVVEKFVKHFEDFLGTKKPVIPMKSKIFTNTLSMEETKNMVREVSEDEIKDAVFEIDGDKAPENKKSLWAEWVNVVKLKYKNIWNIQMDNNDSWGWKTMLSVRDMIKDHVMYEIGKGNFVSVWYDRWNSNVPLGKFITQRYIYDAILTMDAKVSKMIKDNIWAWPNDWSSWFPGLLNILTPILNAKEDKVLWVIIASLKVCFSTKQAWIDLRDDMPVVAWKDVIWFKSLFLNI